MNHISIIRKFPWYQTSYENSWWRRVELRYGNNPKDNEDFISLLKWAIRSQNPNSDSDEDKGEVQRLDGSGSEVTNHHQ